jgi:hypothetical protein
MLYSLGAIIGYRNAEVSLEERWRPRSAIEAVKKS